MRKKSHLVIVRVQAASAVVVSSLAVPYLVLAATTVQTGWFTTLLNGLKSVIDGLVPLLIGIALVVFIWGVIQFITGDDKTRPEGKQKMLWGVVGLFVIVSVWGIVKLMREVSGVGSETDVTAPPIPK